MKFRTPPVNPKVIAALPAALSISAAACIVFRFNLSHLTTPLVLGIIGGGLADLDNRLTGRLKNLFFTLLAFTFSSLLIEFSLHSPLLLALSFTFIAFVFTLSGAVGLRYRTIAFATLAVAVYTVLAHRHDNHHIWYLNPLLILIGASAYSIITILVHLFFPNRPVQESVASAYAALGSYLDTKAAFFDPDNDADGFEAQQIRLAMDNRQVIGAFNQCRSALFYRMRGQHHHPRTGRMLHYYFAAQDIHERVSSSHTDYRQLATKLQNSDLMFRFLRLIELQAQSCRDLADSLRQNGAPPPQSNRLHRAGKGLQQSVRHYADKHSGDPETHTLQRLEANLLCISYQLTHLDRNPETENSKEPILSGDMFRIAPGESSSFKDAWHNVRNNLTPESSTFRHAVRMAVLALVCVLLIESLQLKLGYWILLTAVFVCQPNYSATQNRLKQRIAGTLAGVLVGSLLPYFTPSLEAKLMILALSTTLFFFFRAYKYSYSTFFITIQAIVSFSITGDGSASSLPLRLFDTVLGSLLAFAAVSYLWPDWNYLNLNQTGTKAMAGNARYLRGIIDQLQNSGYDNVDYRLIRRRNHECAAALACTLSDMSVEPDKYGSRLQDGFKLLKINYSLISYISALGAYRSQIRHDEELDRLAAPYFALAERICTLLENIASAAPEDFAAQLAETAAETEALRPDGRHEHLFILWQQLAMIQRLLEPAYQALHGSGKPSATQ
ncbi:MAG: YccS family putative transporter [Neisseria sp.]|nr:YccS family putative transporter [Neisseria sp.]